MVSNDLDEGTGPDPAAGCGAGIKIIDGSAAGVGAVERLPGGPDGGFGHRLVDLPIVHAGEGARLIDHSRDGVGEGGVAHPVEDHGAHRHLAAVGLAPGLRRDDTGQQIHAVALTGGGAVLRGRHAQRFQRGGPRHTVGGKAVFLLKFLYGCLCFGAIDAIHWPIKIAPAHQLFLNGAYRLAGGALPVGSRLGGLDQGNDQNVEPEDEGQRPEKPLSVFPHVPASKKVSVPSLRQAASSYARRIMEA